MKKLVAIALAIAVIGLFLLFQADITSISLNGYSLLYGDVARQYLNEAPLYAGDAGAFCGPPAVQAELKKTPADMMCVPLQPSEISHESCDPVDTAEIVPTYIFPYHNTIVANVAVTVDNIEDIAKFIETSSADLRRELDGDHVRVGSNMLSQQKKITVLGCSGYGIISIEQSYLANYLAINLP